MFSIFFTYLNYRSEWEVKKRCDIWYRIKAQVLLLASESSYTSVCILEETAIFSELHISGKEHTMWSRMESLKGENVSAPTECHVITLNSKTSAKTNDMRNEQMVVYPQIIKHGLQLHLHDHSLSHVLPGLTQCSNRIHVYSTHKLFQFKLCKLFTSYSQVIQHYQISFMLFTHVYWGRRP